MGGSATPKTRRGGQWTYATRASPMDDPPNDSLGEAPPPLGHPGQERGLVHTDPPLWMTAPMTL